ncbi:MAG: hypothetical protein RSF79_00050 [Janthinobacterium sp.]
MQVPHARADGEIANKTIEMMEIYCENGNLTMALKSSPERLLWSNFFFVERRKKISAVFHWSG